MDGTIQKETSSNDQLAEDVGTFIQAKQRLNGNDSWIVALRFPGPIGLSEEGGGKNKSHILCGSNTPF